MEVLIDDSGPANRHPGLNAVSKAVHEDATRLIASLTYGHLLGGAGTIGSLQSCRIDRQPPPAGGANLQVQLNGVSGTSSIATCVIEATVFSSMADWPSGLQEHQRGWLLRRVRVALTRSLCKAHAYVVKGSFLDENTPANLSRREENRYRHRRPGGL